MASHRYPACISEENAEHNLEELFCSSFQEEMSFKGNESARTLTTLVLAQPVAHKLDLLTSCCHSRLSYLGSINLWDDKHLILQSASQDDSRDSLNSQLFFSHKGNRKGASNEHIQI